MIRLLSLSLSGGEDVTRRFPNFGVILLKCILPHIQVQSVPYHVMLSRLGLGELVQAVALAADFAMRNKISFVSDSEADTL